MSYYKRELDRVDTNSESPAKFKFQGNDSTKWLDLNNESAKDLIKWLCENGYYSSMIEAKAELEAEELEIRSKH